MGYQESLVRVTDNTKFDELLNTVKMLGKEFFEYSGAIPVAVVTLKKNIKGNLHHMCMPQQKYNFSTGERFICFCGERYSQRNSANLLHKWAPDDLEIYFIECFPCDKMFIENSTYISEEDIVLESNPEALEEIKKAMDLEWQLEVYGRDYDITYSPDLKYSQRKVSIYITKDNKILPVCTELMEYKEKKNEIYDGDMLNGVKDLATIEDVNNFIIECMNNNIRFRPWNYEITLKDGKYGVMQIKNKACFCKI